MRILIAHSFYRLPGGENRLVQQQAALLARRHDVRLLAESNEELEESMGTATQMLYSPRIIKKVDRAIVAFRPDLIHLHNAYPSLGPAVQTAARRHRIPVIMTVHNFRLRCPNGFMFTEGDVCRRCEGGVYVHGVLHDCFPSKKQAFAYTGALWFHRFALGLESKIARFIAPSEFMCRRLAEWGIPLNRVSLVRNFTHISPHPTPPGRYGIYLGRLSAEKGLDVLVRALKIAGDPPFLVVGNGPTRPALESLADDLQLRHIEFRGFVPSDQATELLECARYLVMPSLSEESAGMAVQEALGTGRPAIVSARGGLPELVTGGAGFLCKPGDPTDLANSIRLLDGDDQLCGKSGERGLEYAKAELSEEVHLSRLEAAYRSL